MDKLLTVNEAAERLGVSAGLIYAWCRLEVLAHKRFGRPGRRGTIRISETDLIAFVEECRREPPESPGEEVYRRHLRN